MFCVLFLDVVESKEEEAVACGDDGQLSKWASASKEELVGLLKQMQEELEAVRLENVELRQEAVRSADKIGELEGRLHSLAGVDIIAISSDEDLEELVAVDAEPWEEIS